LAATGLANIAEALAPKGLLVGTFFERFPVVLPKGNSHDPDAGSGWRYPGTVSFTWREWTALAHDAGLVVQRVRWAHLRQTWFVAARPDAKAHLTHATRNITRTLRGPGALGHAWRRIGKRTRHA
jgi:hypothetical protein